MGSRGPQPQSAALMALRGNPGHRSKPTEPPPVDAAAGETTMASQKKASDRRLAARARCPSHLKGIARSFWNKHVARALRTGHLSDDDLEAVEMMAKAYAEWRRFERLCDKDLDLAIAKGYRKYAGVERKAYMDLCRRLKFDPHARGNMVGNPLGNAETPKGNPVSDLEQFKARYRTGT